jgi:hypothetical protein
MQLSLWRWNRSRLRPSAEGAVRGRAGSSSSIIAIAFDYEHVVPEAVMESVQVQGDDHLVDSWSLDVVTSWLRLGHRCASERDPCLMTRILQ